MPIALILFLVISLQSLASTPSWAGVDCEHTVISGEKIVSHVPPMRTQGESQFCFAMSGMQLVNRLGCVQSNRCAFGSDSTPGADELSVRHAIREYYEVSDPEKLRMGGDLQLFLKTVGEKRRLAPDSCAPFDQLKSVGSMKPTSDIVSALGDIFKDFRASHETPSCFINDHLNDLRAQGVSLRSLMNDLQLALKNQNQTQFMERAIFPDRCGKMSREVPSYKVQTFESADAKQIQQKVDDLIGHDTPLTFAHDLFTRVPSENPLDIFGLHAANIVGKRQACCGDKCDDQYLVADSGDLTGKPTHWESHGLVLKSIVELNSAFRFIKALQSSQPPPKEVPSLIQKYLDRVQFFTGRALSLSDLNFAVYGPMGDTPELTWLESTP